MQRAAECCLMETSNENRTQSKFPFPACVGGRAGFNSGQQSISEEIMIIYAICLVFGLMFMLISAFLGHLFGGHDSIGTGGHAESGLGSDGVTGVDFFSPTVLASFV